jgi:NAD(P)H dehydrogenase (quinone)
MSRLRHYRALSAAGGVQVRYSDFDDGNSLPTAFAGGERMLLISTLDVGERRRRQHGTAVDAAVAAGVQHIAYTSSVGIHPRSPAFVVADHLHTEELLRRCGVAVTILRDSQYAEVVATMIAPLALASGSRVDNRAAGALVTRRLSRQSGRADS